LGFKAINPNFPDNPITVEMILSHQSSLIECNAYNDFLMDSYNAPNGSAVPLLSSLFLNGAKYFNDCTFSKTHKPGTYYQYVNLNFVIVGTIIERLSGQRFDVFLRERFLKEFSDNMNFNPAKLKNPNDLAVLYIGNNGQWQADYDNYKGNIP
jgi:CubicO group peptidase (beta-lactamase class C family)